ncbi:TonB-dependent receptor plug domain-containing protein [Rhodanobacter terrae]|uniref:TonB-dependent receptor plug domain-containing protein n=1 Tax=Rhodanobacter terrae TaxID=418647 RepID=A0ABW0T0B7_9GAMM
MHRVLPHNRLALALSSALFATLSLGSAAAHAQDQAAGTTTATGNKAPAADQAQPEAATPNKAKTLKAVVVTGSLIRRVDAETSSPVVMVDRAAISNSGKPTLGDVLQQLPSISGNATNPQNNSNGGGVASPLLEGGDGASRISLRGLGTNRTLVLIDGQRMANADVNMIPQSMIQRVDVLPEGASTVYGSDAIAGVVNFILRKDYAGAEASINDGISSHGDGQRHGISLTAGANGDNYNIVGGLDYNKYDAVLATQRKFSAHQLYLSSGVISPAGSSTIPTGKIQVPASIANQYGCTIRSNGTAYITLAQGNGSSQSDYRCDRGNPDAYNYNAYNYIQTAQQRIDAFVLGSYKLNDNMTFFADAFFNHTQSSGQDAPAPTGVGDGWHVLSSNPINPFGITFSANPIPGDPNSGYGFNTRLTGLGTRLHTYTTKNFQINTGVRGNFGQSSWNWDASIDYGYSNRRQRDYNEVNIADFQAAIDSGVNIFDQANQSAALRAGVDRPEYVFTNATKQVQLDANGELWDLPAGAMQLAVGALYRQQSMNYTVSPDAVLNLATGNCQVLQEACGSPGRGSDNVKELYAESLIPLLSEQPWAYSLNVDLGVRASDYSTTGTTTNKKIAVEWRPVADLLLRGTVTQVFRAPNLDELHDGVTLVQPTLNDPCVGLTAAQLAQHTAACQYVPVNWTGNSPAQVNTYYSGAATVGKSLKPEHGKSIDFGLVYNPGWLPGVSTSVDFWHVYLSDLLTPIAASTVVNACYANNSSPYCSLINRYDTTTQQPGQVNVIDTPVVNLGNLSTSGIDFTLDYKIPHFDLGSFNPGNFKAGFATTYLANYKNDATPGQPGAQTINYAGTFSPQFGNLSRWRGALTLNWELGNWSAQWQTRYINHLTNLNADAVYSGVNIPMASVLYHSIQLGYAIPSWHTRIDVGVDNITDKVPPLVYQNGLNYNVDTATYDTLGRYYWARATFKF